MQGPGERGAPAPGHTGGRRGLLQTLQQMLCLRAGKVHGSLARAGKVRGQTPKVAKQDKKKQPKGRAMKRIKYNRRFVTAGARREPAFCCTTVHFAALPCNFLSVCSWNLCTYLVSKTLRASGGK